MAIGVRITPPISAKGVFKIHKPFRIRDNKVYEVIAIREFSDLWAEHVDIFAMYYEPVGLTDKEYRRDAEIGAAIITLKGEDGVVYIPDTYIESYPELGLADYQHVVLSVSLGPIARKQNLDGLMNDIAQLVSKHIGVKGKVQIHVAPLHDTLTQQQAKKLEQVRKGHIDVPVSDALRYRETSNKNAHLVDAINQTLRTYTQPKP